MYLNNEVYCIATKLEPNIAMFPFLMPAYSLMFTLFTHICLLILVLFTLEVSYSYNEGSIPNSPPDKRSDYQFYPSSFPANQIEGRSENGEESTAPAHCQEFDAMMKKVSHRVWLFLVL